MARAGAGSALRIGRGELRFRSGAAASAPTGQRSAGIQTVEASGFERLRLPHFYRTTGWLWRCKERIERYLYDRDRDLFKEGLDRVFFDTTRTYFEGRGWEEWAKLGQSRDHRPDHLQLILGVAMRRDGVPVSCEIWPGNLHDTKALVLMLKQLQERGLGLPRRRSYSPS